LQDENGNPAIPVAYYDADGNLLDTSLLNISYVPYTKDDENGNPVRLYYDKSTGQVVTEATHKEATSTKEVECGVDEGYTRKEENVTGWHYEDCDASASDAEVKSEKTVYKDEEGAVLVEEGVKCESGDEGAREVTTTTVTGQETTVETVTLYDSDETLKQIKDLLGDFGITVQEIQINEAQTNVNAGLVTSSNSQTGVHGNVIYNPGGTGDNAGYTMIIEKLADGVYFGFKGNVSEV
jgi:flagellar capping protein FliD